MGMRLRSNRDPAGCLADQHGGHLPKSRGFGRCRCIRASLNVSPLTFGGRDERAAVDHRVHPRCPR